MLEGVLGAGVGAHTALITTVSTLESTTISALETTVPLCLTLGVIVSTLVPLKTTIRTHTIDQMSHGRCDFASWVHLHVPMSFANRVTGYQHWNG